MRRAESDPRRRASPRVEGRPRARRKAPTSRYHLQEPRPLRDARGGNPRSQPSLRLRASQSMREPFSRHISPRIPPAVTLPVATKCCNCGWAPDSRDNHYWPAGPMRKFSPHPRARFSRAKIQSHLRIAPNPLRVEGDLPVKKAWMVRAPRLNRPKPAQAAAAEASYEHRSPAAEKQTISSSTSRRPLTYAQAIVQGQTIKAVSASDERLTSRRSRTMQRPVDPRKEGRCFRCLARDHLARECRDPIKCRLCRQGGHRQAFCPLQEHSRIRSINTDLRDCLIGEPQENDPQWDYVLGGIQKLCPNLSNPDCHRLVSGDIFLRGLSKEDWR